MINYKKAGGGKVNIPGSHIAVCTQKPAQRIAVHKSVPAMKQKKKYGIRTGLGLIRLRRMGYGGGLVHMLRILWVIHVPHTLSFLIFCININNKTKITLQFEQTHFTKNSSLVCIR